MNQIRLAMVSVAMLAFAAPANSGVDRNNGPLKFFEGRTESISTVKVILKRSFKSRSLGRGKLLSDGTLDLIQQVDDEGEPPRERRWKIRQVSAGRFTGTMSDAVGPVVIEGTPKGYRFRFKIKDNMAVEQWLIPVEGGATARSVTTVRRFGIAVAKSEGTIRKIS